MVFLLNLGVVIGQLIVTLGGGFGRGGDIFSGIVLAGGEDVHLMKGLCRL